MTSTSCRGPVTTNCTGRLQSKQDETKKSKREGKPGFKGIGNCLANWTRSLRHDSLFFFCARSWEPPMLFLAAAVVVLLAARQLLPLSVCLFTPFIWWSCSYCYPLTTPPDNGSPFTAWHPPQRRQIQSAGWFGLYFFLCISKLRIILFIKKICSHWAESWRKSIENL